MAVIVVPLGLLARKKAGLVQPGDVIVGFNGAYLLVHRVILCSPAVIRIDSGVISYNINGYNISQPFYGTSHLVTVVDKKGLDHWTWLRKQK